MINNTAKFTLKPKDIMKIGIDKTISSNVYSKLAGTIPDSSAEDGRFKDGRLCFICFDYHENQSRFIKYLTKNFEYKIVGGEWLEINFNDIFPDYNGFDFSDKINMAGIFCTELRTCDVFVEYDTDYEGHERF